VGPHNDARPATGGALAERPVALRLRRGMAHDLRAGDAGHGELPQPDRPGSTAGPVAAAEQGAI
jgi:hypothetical protein